MAQTVIVQRLNDSLHSQRQLKDTLLVNEENEQLESRKTPFVDI